MLESCFGHIYDAVELVQLHGLLLLAWESLLIFFLPFFSPLSRNQRRGPYIHGIIKHHERIGLLLKIVSKYIRRTIRKFLKSLVEERM